MVIAPDKKQMKIPSWMTQPEASHYKISKHYQISIKELLSLEEFIKAITKE